MKIYKKVKDSKLARKMYPKYRKVEEEGYISIPLEVAGFEMSTNARAQVAINMLQMGLIKDMQTYIDIINGKGYNEDE